MARELTLTGRIIQSGEALDLGVVSEVVEPEALMPRALELARAAAGPSGALTKRRILIERQHLFGRLFLEEEWALRQATPSGRTCSRSAATRYSVSRCTAGLPAACAAATRSSTVSIVPW